MGYRIKIERKARSRFLRELRDRQVRSVATVLGIGLPVDVFASAWSISSSSGGPTVKQANAIPVYKLLGTATLQMLFVVMMMATGRQQ